MTNSAQVTLNLEVCCELDIICPPAENVECDNIPEVIADGSVAADNDFTINDACGTPIVLSSVEKRTDGSCANSYTLAREYTILDDLNGNGTKDSGEEETTCTQTIIVTDTEAPVLSVPPNTNIACDDDNTTVGTGSATATDNCDSDPVVIFTDATAPGNCAGSYILTRTWTATDNCGNETSASQVITVTDVTGPVLSGVPADTDADCAGIPNAPTVTATDNCSGINTDGVVLTESTEAGDCAGSYILTRTWTATDDCGNETSASQAITFTDVTGPVLSGVPADTDADCAGIPNAPTVTATDNCSGINTDGVVLTESTEAGDCAGSFILTRTWTVTDNCGNETSASQVITVTDVTGPVLSGVPADTDADCAGIPNAPTVTATDNCSGINTDGVVLTESTEAGDCAGSYILTRTWTATDNCGNETSASQVITVTDVTGPVLSGVPADTDADCAGIPNAPTVTASDNCSGINTDGVVLTESTEAGDWPAPLY